MQSPSSDIDPSRRTLRIRAESTKGRRERVVPIQSPVASCFSRYLQHRSTLGQQAWTALPLRVASQLHPTDLHLELVEDRPPPRTTSPRRTILHTHHSPSLSDRPCPRRLGHPRDRYLRRTSQRSDHTALYPSQRTRPLARSSLQVWLNFTPAAYRCLRRLTQ